MYVFADVGLRHISACRLVRNTTWQVIYSFCMNFYAHKTRKSEAFSAQWIIPVLSHHLYFRRLHCSWQERGSFSLVKNGSSRVILPFPGLYNLPHQCLDVTKLFWLARLWIWWDLVTVHAFPSLVSFFFSLWVVPFPPHRIVVTHASTLLLVGNEMKNCPRFFQGHVRRRDVPTLWWHQGRVHFLWEHVVWKSCQNESVWL